MTVKGATLRLAAASEWAEDARAAAAAGDFGAYAAAVLPAVSTVDLSLAMAAGRLTEADLDEVVATAARSVGIDPI